ncbi:hypothetical protein [Xanthomonas translucens]|uniref:hypothetical protein n=1 Tax=Xanthomonas campestris pv. translucens TaxID=343 RepID=UPI00071B7676|nr:hypothetical protein [Xanthomonas translucens]MCT8281730.1 hypothetical protein [Xanthomonas translucens pv. undulosa]MCT8316516.1 hypothetical protein [Xanthomonas translucens pv. undulosa]UKE38250.1 hypothetical protein KCU58_10755 [Xanthomonas translucens pv. undulosa]
MTKINPEWLAFNNLINEGGEGFNPHPKYISATATAQAPIVANSAGKVYRDSRGMPIDPLAQIADAETRLARVTDPFGRELIERSIANYRKMLEA